jgi:GNAT superfamily N-acetyltransferase
VPEVRAARLEDAAALAEVHVRTWQAAYEHVFGAERLAGLDVEARAASWRRWLGELRSREAVFVAEEAGRPVAFAWVGESRHAGDVGELYAIYALPEAWGGGAGTALMAAAVAALRAEGFGSAVLWVLKDNPRARRFYEREGWTPDGARRVDEHLGAETVEVRYRIEL